VIALDPREKNELGDALKHLSLTALLSITTLVFGYWFGQSHNDDVASSTAIYLIGAVTITNPERLPQYQKRAGPLAAATGGYVPLAFSEATMIEGQAPSPGQFFIERYDSLEGLNRFINSPEYANAKLLRDEVADVHFMMWLPALEPSALPH
jgi:uncharacterized protein (DUF1330 family)